MSEENDDKTTVDTTATVTESTATDATTGSTTDATGTESTTDTVSKEEFEAIKKRMQAADRRASELEAKEKERELAGKSESEKLTIERDELKSKVDTLSSELNTLRLQNAFLTANKHTWADPEDALRLADLSEVEVSAEGKVDMKALTRALDDLAKRKPHLVKVAATEGNDKGSGGQGAASGPEMNGGRKGQQSGVDREALAKRFPVLGHR